MIDQSIHVMDLARWFVDDPIAGIQATIANRNHPEIETEDTAEGLITYRNGLKSVFFATNNFSYNAPVVVETHCEHGTALLEFDKAIITYKNGRELTVVNDPTVTLNEADFQAFFNESTGQAAMRTLNEWGVLLIPVTWKAPRGYWGVSHKQQIDNFYASLEAGVQPDITGEEAIKSLEMILAIYQSSREGSTIRLG
jgi:predicted dehydrogenase